VLVIRPGEPIELTATDATSGVARIEVSIDGGPWTTYASPISFEAIGRHVLAFHAVDNAGNEEAIRVLVVDAVPAFNWTPVLALVFGAVIAALGVVVARRRRESGVALAWAVLAGPAMAVEILVAVYSLATGELSTPPWAGAGLVSVLGVAAGGFASLVIGSKALARGGPPA
jgi:drug/metabolite transporter (DMT)-like permease